MKSRREKPWVHVVSSLPVIVSLILLLLNDWYLKATYGSWITGKLSDFSGIFLLAIIAFAFLPKRKRWLAIGICIGFACWKSPLVQPLIDIAHGLGVTSFNRVVDFTDLIALVMVGVAWRFVSRTEDRPRELYALRRAVATPILAVCILSMVASTHATFHGHYQLNPEATTASIDTEAIAKAVEGVAKRHGLRCVECATPELGADYEGNVIYLFYRIVDESSVQVWIGGAGKGGLLFHGDGEARTRKLRDELFRELGEAQPGLRVQLQLPDELQQSMSGLGTIDPPKIGPPTSYQPILQDRNIEAPEL